MVRVCEELPGQAESFPWIVEMPIGDAPEIDYHTVWADLRGRPGQPQLGECFAKGCPYM